jgi:hypothetical protein
VDELVRSNTSRLSSAALLRTPGSTVLRSGTCELQQQVETLTHVSLGQHRVEAITDLKTARLWSANRIRCRTRS